MSCCSGRYLLRLSISYSALLPPNLTHKGRSRPKTAVNEAHGPKLRIAAQVGHGFEDIVIVEVGQAITAEDQIRVGKIIHHELQLDESARGVSITFHIVLDDLLHDIRAEITLDRQVHLLEPVEIATGEIEQMGDAQLTKELGQGLAQGGCRLEG